MKAASCSSRPVGGVGRDGAARPPCAALARHDRLSVIGALELSPARSRIQLDWQVQRRNLQAEQVVRFACEQATRYGRILLVLYHLEPHFGKIRTEKASGSSQKPAVNTELMHELVSFWRPAEIAFLGQKPKKKPSDHALQRDRRTWVNNP